MGIYQFGDGRPGDRGGPLTSTYIGSIFQARAARTRPSSAQLSRAAGRARAARMPLERGVWAAVYPEEVDTGGPMVLRRRFGVTAVAGLAAAALLAGIAACSSSPTSSTSS